jgi:hypothetical protein
MVHISRLDDYCPVPDKGSDWGLPGLLSKTLKVAFSDPVLLGVKYIVSEQLFPAVIELPQLEL